MRSKSTFPRSDRKNKSKYKAAVAPGATAALYYKIDRAFRRCRLSHIIGVGLEEQSNKIDDHSYTENTDSKDINYTHANFSLIKLMGAENSEEKAKKKCDPFVFRTYAAHLILVCVLIQVAVVDHDLRLLLCGLGTLKIFYLTPAVRANDALFGYLLSAFLAEFCFLLSRCLRRCVVVHFYLRISIATVDIHF